ncbi:unnamed protein product [Lymnaea stagnalis]|uniref:Programmed cell death protein 2 C-terminal domain-containing protein n=1 Tax=Lymnaea stagnalis TaxID=6523 RepID=A0AAV2HTY4_LYMST
MSVLLGVIDQAIGKSDTIGWETSKVGGLPEWIQPGTSTKDIKCKSCNQSCSLIAQLYCPLNGSPFHRCLYIFVCCGDCSKNPSGWRVFRSMVYDKSYDSMVIKKESSAGTGTQFDSWTDDQENWCDDSDDWGVGSGDWGTGSDDCCTNKSFAPPVNGSTEANLNPSYKLTDDLSKLVVTDINSKVLPKETKHSFSSLNAIDSEDTVNKVSKVETEAFALLRIGNDPGSGNDGEKTRDEDRAEPILNNGKQSDISEPQVMLEEIGLPDSERVFAMAQILNTSHKEVPEQSPLGVMAPVIFKPYYLSVVDEPDDHEFRKDDHVADLIQRYEQAEGKQLSLLLSDGPGKAKVGLETYEKTELKHGDKMFHKFLKRLQRHPQQSIRYDRGGKPLLVSELDNSLSIPPCLHCGSEQIFELQLMSPLIAWLNPLDNGAINVDYGTVVVYTCQKNCWPSASDIDSQPGLLEEYIILQADPDHHLYK